MELIREKILEGTATKEDFEEYIKVVITYFYTNYHHLDYPTILEMINDHFKQFSKTFIITVIPEANDNIWTENYKATISPTHLLN